MGNGRLRHDPLGRLPAMPVILEARDLVKTYPLGEGEVTALRAATQTK